MLSSNGIILNTIDTDCKTTRYRIEMKLTGIAPTNHYTNYVHLFFFIFLSTSINEENFSPIVKETFSALSDVNDSFLKV